MSATAARAWRAELTRKALHAGTAVLPIAWAHGWITTSALRALLTATALTALLVEWRRRHAGWLQRQFDTTLAALLRAHERERLTGATWLALAMCLVVWCAPHAAAVAALWAAAVGDAAAALVGRGVQRLGLVAARADGPRKTWVGSAAALLSTALGVWWLTPATPWLAAGLGLVAAVAERPRRPLDDNLRIAFAVAVAASLMGLR